MKLLLLSTIFIFAACTGGGGGGGESSPPVPAPEVFNFNVSGISEFTNDPSPTVTVAAEFDYATMGVYDDETCSNLVTDVPKAGVEAGIVLSLSANAENTFYSRFNEVNGNLDKSTPCLPLAIVTHDDQAPSDLSGVPAGVAAINGTVTNSSTVDVTLDPSDLPSDADYIVVYSDLAGTNEVARFLRDDVEAGTVQLPLPSNQTTNLYLGTADRAGNVSSTIVDASVTLSHDDTPPVTTLDTTRIQNGATIGGTCEEDVSITGDITAGPITCSGGTWSYTVSGLPEGGVSITVSSSDSLSNTANDPHTFELDETAPTLTLVNADLSTNVRTFATTYTFDVSDFTVEGDTNLIEICSASDCSVVSSSDTLTNFESSGISVSLATDSFNNFHVRLTDVAGNISSIYGPYVIENDTSTPAAPTLAANLADYASTYTDTASISVTGTTDASTVTVRVFDQADMATELVSYTKAEFEAGDTLNLIADQSVTYAVIAENDLGAQSTPSTFTVNHVTTPDLTIGFDITTINLDTKWYVDSTLTPYSFSLVFEGTENTYNVGIDRVMSLDALPSGISSVTSACIGTTVSNGQSCDFDIELAEITNGLNNRTFTLDMGGTKISIDVSGVVYDVITHPFSSQPNVGADSRTNHRNPRYQTYPDYLGALSMPFTYVRPEGRMCSDFNLLNCINTTDILDYWNTALDIAFVRPGPLSLTVYKSGSLGQSVFQAGYSAEGDFIPSYVEGIRSFVFREYNDSDSSEGNYVLLDVDDLTTSKVTANRSNRVLPSGHSFAKTPQIANGDTLVGELYIAADGTMTNYDLNSFTLSSMPAGRTVDLRMFDSTVHSDGNDFYILFSNENPSRDGFISLGRIDFATSTITYVEDIGSDFLSAPNADQMKAVTDGIIEISYMNSSFEMRMGLYKIGEGFIAGPSANYPGLLTFSDDYALYGLDSSDEVLVLNLNTGTYNTLPSFSSAIGQPLINVRAPAQNGNKFLIQLWEQSPYTKHYASYDADTNTLSSIATNTISNGVPKSHYIDEEGNGFISLEDGAGNAQIFVSNYTNGTMDVIFDTVDYFTGHTTVKAGNFNTKGISFAWQDSGAPLTYEYVFDMDKLSETWRSLQAP